jgi:signal transduction histidine kinase
MTRIRRRLIVIFLAATLGPLALTLWVANSLLERSLGYSAVLELDQLSRTLESTARSYYLHERDALREAMEQKRLAPQTFSANNRQHWPPEVDEFADSLERERYLLSGRSGDTIVCLRRSGDTILRYTRPLGGVQLEAVRQQYTQARELVESARARDLRRGFTYTFLLLAAIPWCAALAILIYSVHRITSVATQAYNRMAADLQQSRERLLYLARLESWQALARKTAHEVKNSLTPIRLTMEELAARSSGGFEQQAAQIIVDEVNSLERRVRAFSDFAAEPPIALQPVDPAALLQERVSFLRAAHPGITYRLQLPPQPARVLADEDLLKAVVTNLLENAAQAVAPGGEVLVMAVPDDSSVAIEVHDSGPGLSKQALSTLFEPTISFKEGGMGLGLSIARKSAVLCGGDIMMVKGELGGAGFRVKLRAA